MRTLSVVCAAVALGGCSSTNPWSDSFRPAAGESTPSLPGDAGVTIRVVDMDQVRAASEAARRYLEARGVAPEDVSSEDDVALRRAYFQAFRFHEDPAGYEYLGHSGFTGKEAVGRDDESVMTAARRKGANLVFIASEFVGRGTEYRDTPVWTHTTGSIRWRDGAGRRRSDLVNESTTTWVPVPVEVDRYSNVALFYRRAGGAR